MSTSILIEEVGVGAATIINEPNLTAVFAHCYSVTDSPEDVDIPDEQSRSTDVEMEPIATSMEAEETVDEPPDAMNAEEQVCEGILEIRGLPENEPRDLNVSFEPITTVVHDEVVETPVYREDPLFAAQTLVELSRHSWGTRDPNYLRGCVWSPDGTCILVPVHRDGMHVLELPPELYAVDEVSAERPLDILTSAVQVPENGMVYDCCWYPFMNSAAPETCCWLSSQQHGPIQMWDAFDGKLRCSYRGYDAVDEVEAALCVSFSIDGTSVIGGYRKSIRIFRTDTPGRDYTSFPLKSPASCLAVHHTQSDLLAIGSWNGTVSLHDVRSPKLVAVDQFHRPKAGGVTMARFSSDGQRLFVGARKDGVLACWDVRRADEPIFEVRRTVDTNQRIQFDTSNCGRWLVSGDTDGVVRAWDLRDGNAESIPEYQFPLHKDCCNGVSLHPSRPILATASGQHHFETAAETNNDHSTDEVKLEENSLIFWWYGKSDQEETQ